MANVAAGVIVSALYLFLVWLLISFTLWDFDPSQWDAAFRGISALTGSVGVGFIMFRALNLP